MNRLAIIAPVALLALAACTEKAEETAPTAPAPAAPSVSAAPVTLRGTSTVCMSYMAKSSVAWARVKHAKQVAEPGSEKSAEQVKKLTTESEKLDAIAADACN